MPKDNSPTNLLRLQLAKDLPSGDGFSTDRSLQYTESTEERNRWRDFEEKWQLMINFRSSFDDNFQENIERYEAKPFVYDDGRAGVVLPLGKAIIETAQAQESKNPPSFAYSPAEFKEDEAKAKILETIVTKHVWYQKYVNLDQKLDVLNQDKMILGTMYQYVGYRKMYRVIRKKTKSWKPGAESFDTKTELFYDDIVVENLYPQDVWLHPLANTVEESPYCIIRKRYDYATFLETYSDETFYKNLSRVPKGRWTDSTSHGGYTRKKQSYTEKDEVVILELWNKMTDEVIIRANGVEIYWGENPFDDKELPITDYRNRLQHNTYLGESELDRIATLADSICAFINIAIDKEKRAASGINLADSELGDYDETANIFDSSTLTRVDDPKNAFIHYDMPGMSASTDKIIQMLLDFLVFSTGIDFRQITDLSASTKATVAALRREISQQRIQLNVGRNENCGFKRLGWLLAKRVQQFYPIPKVEYVAGMGKGELQKSKYRTIRMENVNMVEEPQENGKFDPSSLKNKGYQEGSVSFFQARPEYLRTKGDLCVRVIPGSTLSAIQELQKTKAQEYVNVATRIVSPPEQQGMPPKPILSVKYGLEKYVEAMGYDLQKAFDTSDKKLQTPAQDEGQPVVDQMNAALGGNVKTENQPLGAIAQPGAPSAPAPQAPPSLTGQRSEPVRDLANELGPQARVTNKPM